MATDGEIKVITLPNNKSYDIVDAGAVRYDEAQTLTTEQKTQACSNIGAAPIVHNHTQGTTVTGSGNAVLNIGGLSATTDYAYLDVNGGSNNARPLVLQSGNKSTGNVGIGVTQPTDKLEVNGTINATGTIKQNGTAVSLSGHTHTKSDITDLGTIGAAAAKSVDSSITASSTSTNLPTSSAVASFVESTVNNGQLTMQVNGTQKATFTANQSGASTFNVTAADLGLTNSMIFVGVSTTDPKSSSGATISGHTTWKKGEVVLYEKKEYVLTGDTNVAANWTELGDEGSFALKSVTITGTGVLSGGGTLESNRTITHNTSGVTAGSYGDSGNQTPAYGGTFKVPYVTVNDTGHVTGISAHTVTIPASDNTDTKVTQSLSTANGDYPVILKNSTTATDSPTSTTNYAAAVKVNPSTGNLTVTKINGVAVGSSPKFTDTTYSAATTSADGLMSSSDKTKLNGIATGATANTITMNGSTNANPTFYAPTTAGTENYVLTSTGSGAPIWKEASSGDTLITNKVVVHGNGTSTITVQNTLNTRDVMVQVYDSNYSTVQVDVTRTTTGELTLNFQDVVSSSTAYTVLMVQIGSVELPNVADPAGVLF